MVMPVAIRSLTAFPAQSFLCRPPIDSLPLQGLATTYYYSQTELILLAKNSKELLLVKSYAAGCVLSFSCWGAGGEIASAGMPLVCFVGPTAHISCTEQLLFCFGDGVAKKAPSRKYPRNVLWGEDICTAVLWSVHTAVRLGYNVCFRLPVLAVATQDW